MADSPDLVAEAPDQPALAVSRAWVLVALAVLGGIAFTAATYLIIRSAQDETGSSLASLATGLRSLERLEAQWTAQAMRARVNSATDRTDPTSTAASVERIRDRMLAASSKLPHEPTLQGAVAEIASLFDRKAALLEHFKQTDPQLKSSLRHVASALNDLVNVVGTEPGGRDLAATAQTFTQRVLHAASTGDADSSRAARRVLDQLRTRPQLSDGGRTGDFLHHAGTSVEQLDRFEKVLAQIDALPIAPRVAELDDTVSQLFDAHLTRNARDRRALALLAVLLAIGLGVIGWHLRRVIRGVESTVAERTSGLEHTVAQLRKAQARAEQARNGQVTSLGQVVQGIVNEIHTPASRVRDSLLRIEANFKSVAEAIGKSETFVKAMGSHPRDVQAVRVRYFDARAALEAVGPAQELQGLGETVAASLQGVSRIEAVVGDLEEFACLEQGDTEACDLNVEIDALLAAQSETAPGVRFMKDFGALPAVWCRTDQIRRAMLNLIANACEATVPGRSTEITLRTRALSDAVQLQVQDNGTGIAPEALPRVFEPFYTTRHNGERTGLGLAIARRIVESHRGSITARSDPGAGSVFTVVLPIGQAVLAKAA